MATTLRSAAGEANTTVAPTAAAASASAGGGERARRGDVDVGHGGGDAQRRPEQRERGEGGDQPVVGGRARRRRAGQLELGPDLAVPVDHALGRAGGAGGEHDRALGVRRRARAAAP